MTCIKDGTVKERIARGKIECPGGEYYDAVYKTCCSCKAVCELSDTFCCNNCPDFCPVGKSTAPMITTSTINLETSRITQNSNDSINSASSSTWLPALTIISVVAVLVLLLVALVALIMVLVRKTKLRQRRSKQQKLLHSNCISDKVERTGKCLNIHADLMQSNSGLTGVVCCGQAGYHAIGQGSDSGESSIKSLDYPDGRVTTHESIQFIASGAYNGNIKALSACGATCMIPLSNEAQQVPCASSRLNNDFKAPASGNSSHIRSHTAIKSLKSSNFHPNCCCFNVDSDSSK